MYKSPMRSLMEDRQMMEEIQDRLHSEAEFPAQEAMFEAMGKQGDAKRAIIQFLDEPVGPVEGVHDFRSGDNAEAIVQAFGRPALMIRNGQWEEPKSQTWRERLKGKEKRFRKKVIPGVGRVELLRHPDFQWVGTAWVIDEGLLMTNRHVASLFAERRGGTFPFRRGLGGAIEARVDFLEEFRSPGQLEIEVEEVVFIAEEGSLQPDVALLRLSRHGKLPAPIELADRNPEVDMMVAVLGYPAWDGRRNPGLDMPRIFGGVYEVKRFAPGFLTAADSRELDHDCTTLGGNSGSPVVDLETGRVVGLHFSGRFRVANSAVPVSVLKQIMARRNGVGPGPLAAEDEARSVEDYAGRRGYREDFLSDDPRLEVPVPDFSSELAGDAVVVDRDLRGPYKHLLNYTHFSVAMSRSRKLALFAAVNIDGNAEVLLKRKRTPWKIDPRIPRDLQFGNELYRSNKLDRGHLVRRLDPVWGSEDEARQADDDSFHYTNCAPQHEGLNQRTWLSLEDYILDNTHEEDLKVCVFTGPVFGDADIPYRHARIPGEYWKVVAMVGLDGKLRATGYLLSQAQLLDDIEFAFGRFRTYQVRISEIEKKTGLMFRRLRDHDPLARVEAIADRVAIESPADLVL